MIRLYFDWNAMVGLKSNRPAGLEDLLLKNKKRFHVIYSPAHLGDIYKSYTESQGVTSVIESDLAYIKKITDELFTYYEQPTVKFEYRNPTDVFNDRIITERIGADFLKKEGLNSLLVAQMPSDSDGSSSPTAEELKIKGVDMTLDIFKKINNSDIYKDMRKKVQQGLNINRDQVYDHPEPLGKLDNYFSKLPIDENTFIEYAQRLTAIFTKDHNDWFNPIMTAYVLLDMLGYKEDKINAQKGQTFANLTADSQHAAYGSQCDFYITNDDRNLSKTNVVYKALGVNTEVVTPEKLHHILSQYLQAERTGIFLENVFKSVNDFKQGWVEEGKANPKYVLLKTFFFDYFNKAICFYDEKPEKGTPKWMIILTKQRPTNDRFLFYDDINILIEKMVARFGPAYENKLALTPEEIAEISEGLYWSGRAWMQGTVLTHFKFINGYFQLYLEPQVNEG